MKYLEIEIFNHEAYYSAMNLWELDQFKTNNGWVDDLARALVLELFPVIQSAIRD